MRICLIISLLLCLMSFQQQSNKSKLNQDWQTSVSFAKDDNQGHISNAKPTIIIKERHIIISHRIEGGGKITSTYLEGSGGTYNLQPGDNDVNPGTYKHVVTGTVTTYTGGPASAIYSEIKYK